MKIQDVRRMWKFLHIRHHWKAGNHNSRQSVQGEEITEASDEAIKIIRTLSERMLQGKFR
jgi:hypothetical protein